MGCLHGDLPKLKRQAILANFRAGRYRALLVSDVASRGLDVADCDVVFNLELPSSAAHYAHRAGRTGRMGAEGARARSRLPPPPLAAAARRRPPPTCAPPLGGPSLLP